MKVRYTESFLFPHSQDDFGRTLVFPQGQLHGLGGAALGTPEQQAEAGDVIRQLGIPSDANYRDSRVKVQISLDGAATILRANNIDPTGMNVVLMLQKVYDLIPEISAIGYSDWNPNAGNAGIYIPAQSTPEQEAQIAAEAAGAAAIAKAAAEREALMKSRTPVATTATTTAVTKATTTQTGTTNTTTGTVTHTDTKAGTTSTVNPSTGAVTVTTKAGQTTTGTGSVSTANVITTVDANTGVVTTQNTKTGVVTQTDAATGKTVTAVQTSGGPNTGGTFMFPDGKTVTTTQPITATTSTTQLDTGKVALYGLLGLLLLRGAVK
jgi:hypothetical protein